MIEKKKVEAIKKLFDKNQNEIIKIKGENIHGWSIKENYKHLHLNILSDREILKLYNKEKEEQNSLKNIENLIFLNKIDNSFLETLKIEIHRANRFNLPLSMIYMELSADFAKKDLELKMVKYIKKTIRPTDFLTSINYNKYLILSTHTDIKHAKKFIERIKHSIDILIDIYKVEVKFFITEFTKEMNYEEFLKKALNI